MTLHLIALATEKSPLKWLLGSLHPGIVHFPIALLSVGALLEFIQIIKKRREPAAGTLPLAYLSALTSVPAALFGFMLADHGGAEGSLVDLHKWLGVATTVVTLVVAGFAWKARSGAGSMLGLRMSLILGAALVGATGYIGGELTMGEGHIKNPLKALLGIAEAKTTEKAPDAKPEDKTPSTKPTDTPVSDKVDFVKDIAPIIRDSCLKCHGGEKTKGKLKLNTKADTMKGGESGKCINPGKPTISSFYTLLIDPDPDVRMPEKAKPLPQVQIDLIKKWIEQGADWPDGYEVKK